MGWIAAKHAPGASVTVELRADREAGEAVVAVANALGEEFRSTAEHGGFGLVSLDERVRRAGGRLLVQRGEKAFTVTARLPIAEPAHRGQRASVRRGSSRPL